MKPKRKPQKKPTPIRLSDDDLALVVKVVEAEKTNPHALLRSIVRDGLRARARDLGLLAQAAA